MPKIIAFTGAHGTGKTTEVFKKAFELKMSEPHDIGIITEVARKCPFKIVDKDSTKTTYESQLWIFTKQIQEEFNALAENEITVSDRTIVDCIAYTATGGPELEHLYKLMFMFAKDYVPITYSQIIFLSSYRLPLKEDGVRNTDNNFRLHYEKVLLSIYNQLKVKVSYKHD